MYNGKTINNFVIFYGVDRATIEDIRGHRNKTETFIKTSNCSYSAINTLKKVTN